MRIIKNSVSTKTKQRNRTKRFNVKRNKETIKPSPVKTIEVTKELIELYTKRQ